MDMPRFTIVVWTKDTNEVFFRDFMDSMVSQTYDAWEMYVIDENMGTRMGVIVEEFFPEDDRIHYRQLKTNKGKAYAYNVGLHFALLDAARAYTGQSEKAYLVFAGQHDRLSPNTLSALAEQVEKQPDIIYTDHDELVDVDRMHPHFKPEFNKELLLHRNYIGEFVAVSYEAARAIGEFQERLTYATVYDYLLRAMEKGVRFSRVPTLLYHQRVMPVIDKKENERLQEKIKKEHMIAVEASFRRRGITAKVEEGTDKSYWKVAYDGSDASVHQREYLVLKEKGVRALSRHSVEKMYALLKQKDVAVVGPRFLKGGFAIENCGYLFDEEGVSYPAFYDQKIYRPSYEQLASIPRDVSSVDGAYCLMDAKVFRKLGGFDPRLSGQDVMLDYCMRVKKAGYRVVVDPNILVRSGVKQIQSSEESNLVLREKWGEQIAQGDPCYSPNMPVGLENYWMDEF